MRLLRIEGIMPINREVNNTYIDRCDDATRRDDSLGVVFFF